VHHQSAELGHVQDPRAVDVAVEVEGRLGTAHSEEGGEARRDVRSAIRRVLARHAVDVLCRGHGSSVALGDAPGLEIRDILRSTLTG